MLAQTALFPQIMTIHPHQWKTGSRLLNSGSTIQDASAQYPFVELPSDCLYAERVVISFAMQVYGARDINVNDQAMLAVFRKAIQEKDQSAWHTIWNHYHPVIARKLQRELTGWVHNGEEIRDIVQMVFIKFWEDSQQWKDIDRLYTEGKQEGILSRLHSTAVFTVQRYRQKLVRKWIPLIRENYPICNDPDKTCLQNLARDYLGERYRDVFLLHLRSYENSTIAALMQVELREISIQINRAWERFVYVMLMHRQHNPSFDTLFQQLLYNRQAGIS